MAHLFEGPVDGLHETSAVLVLPEKARAHHRRQAQRHDAGYGDGAGEGEGEFGEQRARQAALEPDGHIDGDQHHRHRQNRAAEFARRDQRRLQRRFALLGHVPVDVFDDNDRVVDHQTDGKHQREQSQQVDRIAQRQHDEEGADQG